MKDLKSRMHVNYRVSNIAQTVDFYNKFFGTAPVKVKDGYAKYLLEEPALNISFTEGSPPDPQFIHFGIEVHDSALLKRKLGNALVRNLPVDEEKDVKCCYAKQDKFWVTDPDGYRWEVFRFIEDVEQNDAKFSEKGVCCA